MSGAKIIPDFSDSRVSVILPAAGSGSRMGADRPKQWLPLGDSTVLAHTFHFFDALQCVKQIVVVLDGDSLSNALCREQIRSRFDTRVDLAPGGDTRQQSVYEGLIYVEESADIVAIHDAARPFPPLDAVTEAFRLAAAGKGAVLACPVVETIKRVAPGGQVIETLERTALWTIQTPQVFPHEGLIKAYRTQRDDLSRFTDDASVFEASGGHVQVVESTPDNFKITHAHDLRRAEQYLKEKGER